MDQKWFECFADRKYWDELVETYIKTGTAPGKLPYSHVETLWQYFKFCILTDNRYFFEHPLLPLIKDKIQQHEKILPANTTLFRARIDSGDRLLDQVHNLMHVKSLTKLKEEGRIFEDQEFEEMLSRYTSFEGYDAYREQHEHGFEGFPPLECLAPPAHKVPQGRCNLQNSPHLYASGDIHTAIAEIRPFIHDSISVASLSCEKDLRLIDFCFNFEDESAYVDRFYTAMSFDFSSVSKERENDYFATQYLTMLVKSLKYDGVVFRSSLVMDGINYVIFDGSACKPISSKLYRVLQTRYDVLSAYIESHLKDSHGVDLPDPLFPRDE